ncbi:MAG: hypothetical protein Ta2E_08990 [Mycoplasmoidaceae bacterium]|nr:MAG: hypothetical protein Ta2E_08990 [Mycoplasmoidaceae bacterium]
MEDIRWESENEDTKKYREIQEETQIYRNFPRLKTDDRNKKGVIKREMEVPLLNDLILDDSLNL